MHRIRGKRNKSYIDNRISWQTDFQEKEKKKNEYTCDSLGHRGLGFIPNVRRPPHLGFWSNYVLVLFLCTRALEKTPRHSIAMHFEG
jgi:hypothetical protein